MNHKDEPIVREIQEYCAELAETGGEWNEANGTAIADLLNQSEDPFGLFRFIDEKTGDYRVGYKTRDGREWFHILRQMRNTPGSGLFENLRPTGR
jgi:hypothetical protein